MDAWEKLHVFDNKLKVTIPNADLIISFDNCVILISFQIPQVRRMGGCITDHDRCVEHSILLNELSSNFI